MPKYGSVLSCLTVFLWTFLSFGSSSAWTADKTTVVLVRHAEKDTGENPSLTEEGRRRARLMVEVLGDSGISAIYSTSFCRTVQTVQPLAEALGLPITIKEMGDDEPGFRSCDPSIRVQTIPAAGSGEGNSSGNRDPYRELAEEIKARYNGKTVVVVGHTNTIPGLADVLGAPSFCPESFQASPSGCSLPEDEYHHLFVVSVPDTGTSGLIRACYGRRTGEGR